MGWKKVKRKIFNLLAQRCETLDEDFDYLDEWTEGLELSNEDICKDLVEEITFEILEGKSVEKAIQKFETKFRQEFGKKIKISKGEIDLIKKWVQSLED